MADNDISHNRIPAKAAERWALVRKITAGGDCEALGEFLPTLNALDTSAQNAQRNKAYKERAVLYNATGRTRDGLLGLAFRKDPTGEESWPTQFAYLSDDCDGAGVSIYQQSQSTLKAVLETARHGLYVDYSDALKRPIIKAYRAEDIINWRATIIDGKVVLSLVVLAEEAEMEDGYETACVEQWRELYLENGTFNVRIWQRPEKGAEPTLVEQITPRSMRAALDYIPFVFVGAQNNDSSIDDAPLYDLAYINRAHYRNSADYEDSVFLAGQPQPWISGLDETWRDHLEKQGTAYLGSRALLMLPANGAFGISQAQPNTLAKEAMDQKEAQMIALGARLIEASQANRTATESDNDKEASTSVLSMCCANVSEAYTLAISWCARYLDITLAEEQGQYSINQDYVRMTPDAPMLAALVAAWQSGAFAKMDLRAWLRRLGLIAPDRSDEDIDEDLQAEGPALGSLEEAGLPQLSSARQSPPPQQSAESPPSPTEQPQSPPPDERQVDLSAFVAAAEAIAKAAEKMAPQDLEPLIAAINAREAATMEFDVQPIANAMADAIKSLPSTSVTVSPPAVTVEAPAPTDTAQIAAAIAAGFASIPAPVFNVPEQAAPTVNLPEPAKPWTEIEFIENAAGDIVGARKKT